MYPRNNYSHHKAERPISVLLKQVEIARTTDGARRLFRAEQNGMVTGFVEKHFKGQMLVREFALGGPRNGIDETEAKARFSGIENTSAQVPAKAKAAPSKALPSFITRSEPTMSSKSAGPKVRSTSTKKSPSTQKVSLKSDAKQKPEMTREEGLRLAGNLFKGR